MKKLSYSPRNLKLVLRFQSSESSQYSIYAVAPPCKQNINQKIARKNIILSLKL